MKPKTTLFKSHLSKTIFLVTVMVFSLFVACKKSNVNAQNGITGTWQWYSSIGPFGNVSKPASTGITEVLVLNTDSTYLFLRSNNTLEKGTFCIAQNVVVASGINNTITFHQSIANYSPYTNIIKVSNDTLTLATTFSWKKALLNMCVQVTNDNQSFKNGLKFLVPISIPAARQMVLSPNLKLMRSIA